MREILLADDEPHVMRVLKLSLERAGYRVDCVRDGKAAWERMQEHKPDLLIADIQMPRMSGRQLCERIGAEMPERNFPIIILSSRTEIEHRDWTRVMQNVRFLEKPASLRKLTALLEELFQGNAEDNKVENDGRQSVS